MPDLVNLSDVIDGAEEAITAFEQACVALNDTSATDEVKSIGVRRRSGQAGGSFSAFSWAWASPVG